MATHCSLATLALASTLTVLSPAATAQTPRNVADVRGQILVAEARLDSVSRRGDAEGNANLFTDDAIVSLGTLDDIHGRDALRTAMIGFYARNVVEIHRLQMGELEVCGDIAHERGTYLWVAGPRGEPATTERGRYAAMWRRGGDGQWRIHRYLENLLREPRPQ